MLVRYDKTYVVVPTCMSIPFLLSHLSLSLSPRVLLDVEDVLRC